MAIYVKSSQGPMKIETQGELYVWNFNADDITLTPYGHVDIPISSPPGYKYLFCIDSCTTSKVVPIYVDRLETCKDFIRIWHPENTTVNVSIYSLVLYQKIIR